MQMKRVQLSTQKTLATSQSNVERDKKEQVLKTFYKTKISQLINKHAYFHLRWRTNHNSYMLCDYVKTALSCIKYNIWK